MYAMYIDMKQDSFHVKINVPTTLHTIGLLMNLIKPVFLQHRMHRILDYCEGLQDTYRHVRNQSSSY